MTLDITDELRLAFKAHYGDERGRTADANRAFDEFAAGWQARDAEIAALQADAERLDWMDRFHAERSAKLGGSYTAIRLDNCLSAREAIDIQRKTT
jgi:hypothetical protein